tara:strand:+ start:187 stop:918 length:732 start_codon:yes stop_codon:yes gene_type:complete
MPISVDRVYQKVLAIANKEQRGYVTPQEFNLFADLAQTEIFEQYFYDLNQFQRLHGNNTVYADVDDMLIEKLQIFEESDGPAAISGYTGAGGGGINKVLPDYIYRVHRVEYNNRKCEILNTRDFNDVRDGGPLTKPSDLRPITNIRNNILRVVANNNEFVTATGIFYFKRPASPKWTYIVSQQNNTPLWNPGAQDAQNFELHDSEESELVYKILKLAGVSMVREDIMRAGQGMESAQLQQEKQ